MPVVMQAKRSDALRVFVLEKYGGLYLDFDIECYRPADESFKQYSIVLQGTGDEGINNAAMASMPGHPLWKLYADVLTERSTLGTNQAQRAPMWMTGTLALTKGIFQLLQGAPRPPSGYLGGEYKVGPRLACCLHNPIKPLLLLTPAGARRLMRQC